jgi:SSS family solute:Na+ symporter/sodium/proline symporter
LVCGLFWKRGTNKGILSSTILGFLTVLLWTLVFGLRGENFHGIQAIIPGQIVGWVTFIVVSLASKPLPKTLVDKAMKY